MKNKVTVVFKSKGIKELSTNVHMLKMDFKHLNEELRQTVVLLERITSYQEHTEDD